MRRYDTDRRPLTYRLPESHFGFAGLPTLALFGEQTAWLSSTLLAPIVLAAAGTLCGIALYIARRMHWITKSDELSLRGRLRVLFGALFIAAGTLPFLLSQVPKLTVAVLVFGALVFVPYRLRGLGDRLS